MYLQVWPRKLQLSNCDSENLEYQFQIQIKKCQNCNFELELKFFERNETEMCSSSKNGQNRMILNIFLFNIIYYHSVIMTLFHSAIRNTLKWCCRNGTHLSDAHLQMVRFDSMSCELSFHLTGLYQFWYCSFFVMHFYETLQVWTCLELATSKGPENCGLGSVHVYTTCK
jgi:hypothetical protein